MRSARDGGPAPSKTRAGDDLWHGLPDPLAEADPFLRSPCSASVCPVAPLGRVLQTP